MFISPRLKSIHARMIQRILRYNWSTSFGITSLLITGPITDHYNISRNYSNNNGTLASSDAISITTHNTIATKIKVQLLESDLEEVFVRGGGPGELK